MKNKGVVARQGLKEVRSKAEGSDEEDPLAGVANFFDLGIVFALGFMGRSPSTRSGCLDVQHE